MTVARAQEYVVNGLEMRAMTVSRATAVVATTGNSNGFHLDCTHSSIRGRAGEEEEGRTKGPERYGGLNKGGRCADMYLCIHRCPINVQFIHINDKLAISSVR